MYIPPKKPFEGARPSKRKFESLSNTQHDASSSQLNRDDMISKDEPYPKKTLIENPLSVKPNQVLPILTKQVKINFGPKKDHFRSINHLTAAHKKDFFPYIKPLMFLRNANSTIFVLAKPYLSDWKSESNAAIFHDQKPPRSIDLIAAYVNPITGETFEIGPIAPYFSSNDDKSHLAALLSLPGGDSKNIYDERELTTLAQCMFCFDIGRGVPKNSEVAQALELGLHGEDISDGIHMAMHHASANNDYEGAMYFLSKGGNPKAIWDENHEHSLDMAIRNNNGLLVSEFLSRFTINDIKYLRYLLGNRKYEEIDMVNIVKLKITELEEKSKHQ